MSSDPAIRLANPADIAAAVGYLLGYQPSPGAIVTLGLRDKAVVLGTCVNVGDLPPASVRDTACEVVDRLAGNDITAAILLAYGDLAAISGPAATFRSVLDSRAIAVVETLRVAGQRCWCLSTDTCLPVGGVPIPTSGRANAAAVYAGLTIQPDRESLAHLYMPVDGPRRRAMHAALEHADQRLRTSMYGPAGNSHNPPRIRPDAAHTLLEHGTHAVDAAFAAAARDQELPDDDAAWLLMHLQYLPVRDHAWKQITAADSHHHLLRGLLQRAPNKLAAPPACLLAFWALLAGHGPVANIALDRASTTDPAYTMTRLLTTVMRAAIPPAKLHDLFTQALAADTSEDH